MCKKVAQLTRVIFYLNTKNDDYENNLKAVVNAYENELDNTLKEVYHLLCRPTASLPSIKMQPIKLIKIQTLKTRSKRFRITSKKKKKGLSNNSKSTNVLARKGRPNKPQKHPESCESMKTKWKAPEVESKP